MSNLVKQAGLALASFGLATAAFAGSYSEGCDCEVTVPKLAGGIRVGVEALYHYVDLKDTNYALGFQSQSGVHTFRSHNVGSDRDWGLAVELAYIVAGTGNDFVLNYTNHSFSASSTLADVPNSGSELHSPITGFIVDWTNLDSDFGTPGMSDSSGLDALTSVKGSYDVDYSKIDLEAGQAIKIGKDSVTLRFHAGLRYADLDTKFKAFLFDNDETDNENGNFVAESDFDGFGPRFGIDGAWHLSNGFSVIAEVSAALLVGNVSSTWKYEDTDADTPPVDFRAAHRVSYDHTVVPNVEGRLGVNYQHHFSNNAEMNVQAGWQVTNYFDVDYKADSSGTDVAFSGLYAKVDYTL